MLLLSDLEKDKSHTLRKRQGLPLPGCAWLGTLGRDQAAVGALTRAVTDHDQLQRRDNGAARSHPRAEGLEML